MLIYIIVSYINEPPADVLAVMYIIMIIFNASISKFADKHDVNS